MRLTSSTMLFVFLGLAGCSDCPQEAIHTSVRVYAPHPGFVPRHCLSSHEVSCREADEVVGLAHVFHFEQRSEGRLWCSYGQPPGNIRTPRCADAALSLPPPTSGEARELVVVLRGCEASNYEPVAGDACSVRTQARGLPRDSCGDAHFCRADDSTCQALPEDCQSDADCTFVSVCDETELCVRYVCARGECVYPDECLDTSDCHRSHSRCPEGRECDTFTCETGRCVGASRTGD
ncbi:MAG: hypothetical protein AB8H86_30050 [Polyangiales bacterium]